MLSLVSKAQNTAISEIRDSLQNYPFSDLKKVDILNSLSWEIHRYDLDSAAYYASHARALAMEIDYPKGYGRALNILAIVASFKEEKALSHSLNEEALAIAKEINDSTLLSQCLNDLAIDFHEVGNWNKALEYYLDALRYSSGNILGQVFTLSNISSIYLNLHDEAKASSYLIQTLELAASSRDSIVICIAKGLEGDFYQSAKNHPEALTSYQDAYQMAVSFNDKISQVDLLQKIGQIQIDQKQYELAIQNFQAALDVIDIEKNAYQHKYIISSLAGAYLQAGMPEEAITISKESLLRMEENQVPDLVYIVQITKLLADAYAAAGDYEQAYTFFKKYNAHSDTLYQENSQRAVAELTVKFDLEQKEQRNELLQSKQVQNLLALKLQRSAILALAIILILSLSFGYYIWRSYQEKKIFSKLLEDEVENKTASLRAANDELLNTNEELERFNHIASHDLKEPLRNIIGFVDLIQKSVVTYDPPKVEEYYTFVKINAHRLYRLLEDVLEISKVKHTNIDVKSVEVNKIIDQVEESLSIFIKDKKAKIIRHELPILTSSEAHLYIIFKNLIENALKYNHSNPPIVEIRYHKKEDSHVLQVKDNGIGIAPEYKSKIFEMFFRLHARQDIEGSGLGLAIVKKVVTKLKGDLSLTTEVGQGSTFEFSLPIN